MKDERKLCANCHHEHAWGILRYSLDNVPLYGARKCWCYCDRFVESPTGEDANLPAMTQQQTESLWQETSFLNAQVPAATRMVVKKLMDLGEGKDQPGIIGRMFGKGDGKTPIERQWPEFIGFVISQITDMRGALVRDDSKFAHLVSHTDEVVESMKGVVQLNERLMTLGNHVNEMAERMDKLEGLVQKIADAVLPTEPEIVDAVANLESQIPRQEARRVFLEKTAVLRDEPIVTDADHLD